MTDLDVIKNTLDKNKNLSSEVKDNLFELIVVFNKEFSDIKLDNLNDKLKDLKISKISSLLTKKVSKYDYKKNIIYFNEKELEKDYDARHLLMFDLLQIISSKENYNGFNAEGKFEALNLGYTEMMANYLVGNSCEKMLYPHESVMIGLLGCIVDEKVLRISYFNNDHKLLIDTIKNIGIDLSHKDGFMKWNELGNYYSDAGKWDQDKIQDMFISMIKYCSFNEDNVNRIESFMIINNACLGEENSENKKSIDKFRLVRDSLLETTNWIEETKAKVA